MWLNSNVAFGDTIHTRLLRRTMTNIQRYSASDLPELMEKIARNSIGLDDYFQQFWNTNTNANYPPYNIHRSDENNYKIEVALAGYSKDDIEVELKDNTLTVRNKQQEKVVNQNGNGVIHKGISTRQFERAFTISEDIKIKNAELKNGLLNIDLERIIPEDKKARLIEIK